MAAVISDLERRAAFCRTGIKDEEAGKKDA
jgi:hypothetical protein